MSAQNIRAGGAHVELAIRDRLGQGLNRAQNRLKAFAGGVKVMQTAVASALTAAAGGGILATLTNVVSKFMEVSKYAKDIGVAIAGVDPSKYEKLNAAFKTAQAVLGAIQFFLGAALAEPLTRILHLLIGVGIEIARFIRDNQQLVMTIAAVGAGLAVAGTAIVGLGAAIGLVGVALGAIGSLLAALFTPLGAIVAVIVGGVAAWAMFTDAGQNAVGGIAAAIANGDIQGAFAIVVQSLATMWAQWSELVVKVFAGAARMIINQWKAMVATITNGILDLANMLPGWVGKQAGIDIQGIQAQRDKDNARARAMGLPEMGSVLGEAKGSVKDSLNSLASPVEQFIKEMEAAATGSRQVAEQDLKGMTDAQRNALKIRLKGVEGFVGKIGTDGGLGSSIGQFGGAAAGMLGVGTQSRMEQKQDETNNLLKRIIDSINGLEIGVEAI